MGCCGRCFRISTYILVPLAAVLLFLHLECVKEKEEKERENKFTVPYRPDDTVIKNYPLPFCKQGSTVITNIGKAYILMQGTPCCVMKLLEYFTDVSMVSYSELEEQNEHNVTFQDARKLSPGSFNETGFTMIELDTEAETTDWRTNYMLFGSADVVKFHKVMEPHLRKLYPGVKRFRWMNNVVRGGSTFGDQPAAINGPHLDYHQNNTARIEFHKKNKAYKNTEGYILMEESNGEDQLGVMLGIWKPIIPGKLVCDHPLAILDARTFSPKHDNPNQLHIDFLIGYFHNLNGAISYDPKQQWFYYPFQSTKEVLVFHQYSAGRFWANPHTSFINRNCPSDTVTRISAELRVNLYF